MEKAIAVRDIAFWWLGVWTLCTGIDIAVWRSLRRRHLKRRGEPQFYDQDADSHDQDVDSTDNADKPDCSNQ